MRNDRIDALRGVAVLLVVVYHATGYVAWTDIPVPHAYISNGFYGVTTFFVISGFLITSRALAEGDRFTLRGFYTRRIARIFPCLLLALGVTLAFGAMGVPGFEERTPFGVVWSVLTFQFNSFVLTKHGGPTDAFNPLWSLSIEEMFYLLFPALFFFIRQRLVVVGVLVLVVVTGPISRFVQGGVEGLYSYVGAFDQIAMGCIVAFCVHHTRIWQQSPSALRVLRYGGALLIAFEYALRPYVVENATIGPSIVGLGAALFILGAAPVERRDNILKVMGRWSYEIYLFHMIGFKLISRPLSSISINTNLSLLIAIAAVVVVSGLISKFYSEPVNRLIRRSLSEIPLRRLATIRPD